MLLLNHVHIHTLYDECVTITAHTHEDAYTVLGIKNVLEVKRALYTVLTTFHLCVESVTQTVLDKTQQLEILGDCPLWC